MNIFSLPLGIKEYTTKDVKKIDFISSVILEESELWGFKKIITPIFENINSLNVGLKEETINKTIKFIDPLNGDVLGLMSDITPQIARYVSSNYKTEKMPLRLTYNERVDMLQRMVPLNSLWLWDQTYRDIVRETIKEWQ